MARILVIDDNRDMLTMLQVILEKRGQHHVILCEDGTKGLEKAFAEQPDAALVDVMMPGLSGYEVVQKLRDDPRTEDMGIIILTARGQPVDKAAALAAGADDHMPKPVTADELLNRINTLLSGKQEPAGKTPKSIVLPVFSLRGGSGVTTLAVNLASLLQQIAPTVLVDLSPNSGHCALFLGLNPKNHWGQYLDIPTTPITSLLLQHRSGLQLLSAPPVPIKDSWFSDDELTQIVEQLKAVARFTVFDMPPVLSGINKIMTEAYRIVLVSGDDPPAVQTTLGTLQALQKWKEHIAIVRNTLTPGPHPPAEALQRALRAPLAADVPYDPTQTAALRKGVPLVLAQPKAPLASGLKRLAQVMLAR